MRQGTDHYTLLLPSHLNSAGVLEKIRAAELLERGNTPSHLGLNCPLILRYLKHLLTEVKKVHNIVSREVLYPAHTWAKGGKKHITTWQSQEMERTTRRRLDNTSLFFRM